MPESDLHQQIGRLIADIETLKRQGDKTDERFDRIVQQLRCIDQKVTQHRTGWQTFMWLGWLVVAAAGVVIAIINR